MLSYRHAFHAGNFADILKHTVWAYIISYLNRKPKSYTLCDTHAGAGLYSLNDERLLHTKEAKTGIIKLLQAYPKDEGLINDNPYIELTRLYYRKALYPGSPIIALSLKRPIDKLILIELHKAEVAILKDNMRGAKNTSIWHKDCYKALASLPPPPTGRGAALIDPSYEDSSDFNSVILALKAALLHWKRGIYALWYPLLARRKEELYSLHEALYYIAKGHEVLDATLSTIEPRESAYSIEGAPRLYGSGMLVVNPPYRLKEYLYKILPLYSKLLWGACGIWQVEYSTL